MGWWGSLWGSDTSSEDPLRKLDPKLRAFLEKESPVKYTTEKESRPDPQTASRSQQQQSASEQAGEGKPSVPRESEFQDGRYAHLWKTYRPLKDIEAETKSDHEKLMDVLEGYKERKSQIGRAALENCALEQIDWRACMNNPSFMERMTLCREQVKKFEKCYTTQTRLLKALGYLSTLDRTAEVEEAIQMHADSLYHRMLSQEAEVETAKAEGRPIPKFPPLVTRAEVARTLPPIRKEDELTSEQQERVKEKLEKIPEEERAAEEEAIKAEIRAKAEIAARVTNLWKEQAAERQMRIETGQATVWDKVAGAFKTATKSADDAKPGDDKK